MAVDDDGAGHQHAGEVEGEARSGSARSAGRHLGADVADYVLAETDGPHDMVVQSKFATGKR